MYKCNNCNIFFDIYDTITEDSGEKLYVCPSCRGTDFDEANSKCEYCGNYFTESRIDNMCEDCLDGLETRFSNMLHNNFTEYERKALNVIYDGRDLK